MAGDAVGGKSPDALADGVDVGGDKVAAQCHGDDEEGSAVGAQDTVKEDPLQGDDGAHPEPEMYGVVGGGRKPGLVNVHGVI